MTNQKKLIDLCKSKGYNKFHPQWFENNKLNSETWYLELCLLQKWLREKHKFFLGITCDGYGKFDYHGYDTDMKDKDSEFAIEIGAEPYRYNSYEKALEIGLQEELKLIKI